MTLTGRRIVVVGGGIGGLAAALALSLRGAEVKVLEQAETIRAVGAGIQISPNGGRVIQALGLGGALASRSCPARAVVLRDYRAGQEVLRLDLTTLPADQEYHFVHRADLVDLLAERARAAGVQIRLLQKVAAAEPGTPPRLALCNGDHCGDAALVIGADGLHSVVRRALSGGAAPVFTGQVAWRAIVPNDVDHPPEATVHMGPGRHLVSYPLGDGAAVNIVAAEERSAWTPEGWAHEDDPANLANAFSGFGGFVPDLLKRVDRVGLWGLFRHPVAPQWYGDGIALLGDAAHPTLPFLAQGANMALEDAWTLAACLDADPSQPSALARYQHLRKHRCRRIVAAATGNAWKYHLTNPLIRGAAHLGLGLAGRVAPQRMLRQFDWLYGHDVTA
ncbi:monooxygenase [Salipiger aestuarii]|uniref:Salicylate hydroxylase n=1 Tax=Salipiger aestuarii TaxID=568098 RepID=A0A327Y8P2_9RHOB|nr:FAD-dependent monooxygenase [Salipiger aestuarii]EIE51917.1 monooxygenase, FAD-binding protein [Citreicella sp. 357]KAA8608351.1 monooxygenase [Salipiger aestuarii]KAB2542182.1 monooxygenase [Salipiger aestuarii]RAK16847.1 salicylate hydroxylase [Salipiger aestuarii]